MDFIHSLVAVSAEELISSAGLVLLLVAAWGGDKAGRAISIATFAVLVGAGSEQDFAAQIRHAHFQAQLALMLGHRLVGGVDINDVRLAGLQAHLDNFLEELTRVDLLEHAIILR